MRYRSFIAIEDVLNIYDDRVWYYIPGFNGYELSNDGIVRSMKHYRVYPFGILIRPKTYKGQVIHPQDPSYELSNDNNERVTVLRSQLAYLAKTNPYHTPGYPRRTTITDPSSRNQRCAIKRKVMFPDKTPRAPQFTLIKDQNEYPGIRTYGMSGIICPVEDLNGGDSRWRRRL